MAMKPFRTIEQQMEILKGRNLRISDPPSTKNNLAAYNYYRLSGYSLTLRKNDMFDPSNNFSDIMQIYNFDKRLKYSFLFHLEDVEISLRAHIAYTLGEIAPDSYIDATTYISEAHFKSIIEEIENCKNDCKHEAFIKHHYFNRGNELPIWVLVETFSFGALSRFFLSLNVDIKKEICNKYYHGLRYTYVENWLECLVVLRNICAHHSRLYNRGLPSSFKYSTETFDLLKSYGYNSNEIGKKIIFSIPIIEIMSPFAGAANSIINDIENLQNQYPFIDLKHYGFCHNHKSCVKDAIRSISPNYALANGI